MRKKELSIFRKKEIKDLKKILAEKRKEAEEAFSGRYAGQEKNSKKYRNLRREIAQILTIMNEKAIIEAAKKGSQS